MHRAISFFVGGLATASSKPDDNTRGVCIDLRHLVNLLRHLGYIYLIDAYRIQSYKAAFIGTSDPPKHLEGVQRHRERYLVDRHCLCLEQVTPDPGKCSI